jgi:hypothetical protein
MIDDQSLIPVTLAARRFGVSEPTFRRRKLVRVNDVDGPGSPVPLPFAPPEGGA